MGTEHTHDAEHTHGTHPHEADHPDGGHADASTHFDEKAATWDDADKIRRSDEIARAVGAAVTLTPTTRLLEYGAGTGLVSQALQDRVGSITLADTSSGMRAVLTQKIADGALPADARVLDLDLATQDPPADRFDVVVCSMVLHHVADLARVLTACATVLDAGGHLCIADLDLEDGSFHADSHAGEVHHGFDRAELAAAMQHAGFTITDVADCEPVEKEGRPYPVFLMTGRRT